MKKFLIFSIFLLLFSVGVFAQSNSEKNQARDIPADFKSDGCSMFPDGNYFDCCYEHDLEYYHGGSWKARWRSDRKLYQCVKNKGGFKNKIIAPMMWVGVRIGAVPFLPTPFRWGFGKNKKPQK